MALPPITPSMLFVFAVILGALVLFATERVPIDVTAIGVMVALLLAEPVSGVAADLGLLAEPMVVLSDPAAGITAAERGISGFANAATITVLGLMYVVTALLTNIISNNASVVLMVPVAVTAARNLGANPFSFVLAVAFAASTAFMTPVGYQTNLFVYGPGGYRFSDYLRVGGPLQAVFAVVTTRGIAAIWGI